MQQFMSSHVLPIRYCTAQKMKFSIKDFFRKRDQIRSFLFVQYYKYLSNAYNEKLLKHA